MARGSHTRGRGFGGGSCGDSGRGSGGGSGGGSGRGLDRTLDGATGRASDASSAAAISCGPGSNLDRDDSPTRSRSPTPLEGSRLEGGPSTETTQRVAARRGMYYIEGDKLVCDEDAKTSRVSSCITEIFKSRLVEEGTEWKTIPREVIDVYFEEFKEEMEAHKRVAEEHNETMDYDKVFVDIVGLKKRRLFGTGSYGSSIASMSPTSLRILHKMKTRNCECKWKL